MVDMHIEGEITESTEARVSGWAVNAETEEPIVVQLFAGMVLINTVRADAPGPPRGRRRSPNNGFTFPISAGLRELLPRSVPLHVVANGSVRIPCREGVDLSASTGSAESFEPLLSKLLSGYRVSAKSGALFLPLGGRTSWENDAFEAYDRARVRMREVCGHELVLGYGTLLGAVREGHFIGHDDDFDAWFFVESNSTHEAAQLFHSVVQTLIAAGERLRVIRSGQFHWRMSGRPTIDVFMGWFSDGEFFSYCSGGRRLCARDVAAHPSQFLGRDVLIPGSPELLLEATYGPNWRRPDPLFQWRLSANVKREMAALEKSYDEIGGLRHDK